MPSIEVGRESEAIHKKKLNGATAGRRVNMLPGISETNPRSCADLNLQ
jgi:hypothetical protein